MDHHGEQRRGHVGRNAHREDQRRSHHAKPYDRRGGGGGRAGGGKPHESQQEESAEQRISSFLIRVGDKVNQTFKDSMEALAKIVDREYRQHSELILKTMRACITELPMKSGIYATFVGVINRRSPDTAELFVRMAADALQQALNRANWRQVKILLRFFSELFNANVISNSEYTKLLRCFTTVFEEPQLRRDRADCIAYILMDTLVYSALEFKKRASTELDGVLSVLEVYIRARQQQPAHTDMLKVFQGPAAPYPQEETILLLWQQLTQLREDNWELPMLPKVYTIMEDLLVNNRQHSLPAIKIPDDNLNVVYPISNLVFRLFADDQSAALPISMPSGTAIARHVLRDIIVDLLELYEVNRKECLKYLVSLREYFQPATFYIPTPAKEGGAEGDEDTTMPEITSDVGGWRLDAIIIEIVLGKLFELPAPEQKLVYYGVILMEMCKVVPDTFPLVFGRAISLLFDSVEQMDVGCMYRLCDFFVHHLSNFAFHWNWSEWSSVLQLDRTNPKRVFVRETLNKTIQLSYYDRIKTNLPEEMLVMIPPVTPGPRFRFGGQAAAKANPEQVALANALLDKLRTRSELSEVRALLNEFVIGSGAEDGGEDANGATVDEERQRLAREVLFQCVLLMGSKSFSHMMNITERCLPLLKEYSAESESKLQVIRIAEAFWFENTQFFGIIMDRFLIYRLVDPISVVQWLFDDKHMPHFDRFHYWVIMHRMLSKVVSKVQDTQKKLIQAREAHITNESRRMVDVMDEELEQQRMEKEAIAQLESTYDAVTREQKEVFLSLFQSFSRVITLKLAEFDQQGVDANTQPWCYWTMGWMRDFGRYYYKLVEPLVPTLSSIVFTSETDPRVNHIFEQICQLINDRREPLQLQ
ncbi:MIF4G like-domain-containing protein [Syncephalis fuscata]|nr:MIF4G like-domain-containing protein [Syncephalis fuscata]